MLRREEARLSNTLRRLLLLSLASPAAIVACTSADSSSAPDASATSADAATNVDGTVGPGMPDTFPDSGEDASAEDTSTGGGDGGGAHADDSSIDAADAACNG